jgi:ABC-type multidrug transport system fused ATPase/permease subunit
MFFKKRVETDEEVIAKIRKQMKTGRKLAILSIVSACLSFIIGIGFVILLNYITKGLDIEKSFTWAGFVIGLLIGLSASNVIFSAVRNFYEGISLYTGKREYKLLLKYYDQLNPSEK